MAGLKDQLLKSGLINDKQLKKAARDQHKESQLSKQQGKPTQQDSQRANLQQAQQIKIQRDRELEQSRKQAAELKALSAQIGQMIEQAAMRHTEGDLIFSFADLNTVKRLHLNACTRDQLSRGLAGIVKHGHKYHIVPRETVEKIRQRDASAVTLLNPHGQKAEISTDEDPYAAFQVPDDLIW